MDKLKLYAGKNKKTSTEISFRDLLIAKLKESNFQMDNGGFWNENYSWISIVQDDFKENKKDPKQIAINFGFNHNEDKITDVNVYSTPIVTIVDDVNSKKLI